MEAVEVILRSEAGGLVAYPENELALKFAAQAGTATLDRTILTLIQRQGHEIVILCPPLMNSQEA